MRNAMTVVALAGAASVAAAQSTVYFSDFEADGGGWTPSGVNGDWERGIPVGADGSALGGFASSEPVGGFSGDFVWGTGIGALHGVGSDEQLSQNFDFSGLTDISLSFQEWSDSGSSTFDMASVIVNGDQLYLSDGDSMDAWRAVNLDLNAYAGLSSVDITFNFTSTTVVERTGWYIDDVEIRAVPAPASLALLGLGGLAAARRRR
ncbi:MAG: PEP-CTERM sorting domain-containing protein [Phycisphaerales bacterium]|nr:PEP-CTERM sorting domain-containing protein [Phycisphaerales bacterium]